MKRPDVYTLLFRIPHFKTRRRVMALYQRWLDSYDRWKRFFGVMADEWWELRFAKRHRPSWGPPHVCRCGYDYSADGEDGWYDHKVRARDQEWDKRWS